MMSFSLQDDHLQSDDAMVAPAMDAGPITVILEQIRS